jgi:hypothetical protein
MMRCIYCFCSKGKLSRVNSQRNVEVRARAISQVIQDKPETNE